MQRPSRQTLWRMMRRLFPWIVTALCGAGLALIIQALLRPTPLVVQVQFTTAPTAAIILTPAIPTQTPPAPEPTPPPNTPTAVRLPSDTISLEIITLQTDLDTANGHILVLKAASRLQQARFDLGKNDLNGVASQLAVAQEDLDTARRLVPESLQGALQVAITEINYLRDDLTVRPEQIDNRLSVLWETLTSLVDIQQP